jgi:hypothetical protein
LFHDFVQRVYTDDGNGDGHLTPGGMALIKSWIQTSPDDARPHGGWSARLTHIAHGVAAPASMFTQASRRQCLEKADEMFDRIEARTRNPLHQDSCADLLEEIKSLNDYPLIQELFPALLAIRGSMIRTMGSQRGTVTGVALARFFQKYHRWPQSLHELVGELLDSLPRDPVSGEPLRYRRADVGQRTRQDSSPVVYSVGVDRDDDGGQPTRINSDGSIPPPGAAGGDRPVPAHEFRLTLPAHLGGDWVVWPRRFARE